MLRKISFNQMQSIIEKNANVLDLMKDLFNYKDTLLHRVIRYKKTYIKAKIFINNFKKIEPKNISLNPNISIKFPSSLDNISFLAMMELQALDTSFSVYELIKKTLSITCFEANYKANYDSDSYLFKEFHKRISETSAYDVMGLFNHISKIKDKGDKFWQTKFLEVQVIDNDYLEAGGNMLNNYNIINSIKNTCADFNVSEKEAWQMSFGKIQTSSLEKATRAYVQNNMTKIKESRMKQNKNL